MDTSKTYIDMSNHPKIQGQWKPQEGDCFSFIGDIHILADYEIDALNKRETDVESYNEVVKLMGGHFVDHWNECRDGFTWLPYQHQIQEMMDFQLHNMMMVFTDFVYANKVYKNVFMVFASMEQLWLAFYMSKYHRKAWNGKKWVIK